MSSGGFQHASDHPVIIRAWNDDDQGAVDALVMEVLGPGWREQPLGAVHGPDRDAPRPVRRTLVAVDGGRVIGAGTLWENELHPDRWRVTLHVSPPHRGQGTGWLLLTRLRSMRTDRRLVQAGTSAGDRDGCRFFERHGFHRLMRTRRGVVPADAVAPALGTEITAAQSRLAGIGYEIMAWPELPDPTGLMPKLARLHAEIYGQGHGWDPVKSLTDDEASELFLAADDLLPDAMFIALAENQPVAVASLRPHPAPDTVELGWVGVATAHVHHADDLTLALIGRCLERATIERWQIQVEVDEVDTRLWSLVARLPAALEPDWLTYAETDLGA